MTTLHAFEAEFFVKKPTAVSTMCSALRPKAFSRGIAGPEWPNSSLTPMRRTGVGSFCNVNIFTDQADVCTLFGLAGFGMGQQPLVPGSKPLVLGGFVRNDRLIRIRSLGQRHQNTEALLGGTVAGGIV